MNTFLTREQLILAMQQRAATRAYDPSRTISDEDFHAILECARLSPSSVGSEPWRFLVIQNPAIRQALKPVSWGMVSQVDDASHLVVILAKKNARFDTPFFKQVMARRGLNAEQQEQAIARYQSFQKEDIAILENERTLFDWASKQTYIALANMMTGAALLGIDSCPIEGFHYAKVNEILCAHQLFDQEEWGVSLMVTFGYRAKAIKPKSRQNLDDIVQWVK